MHTEMRKAQGIVVRLAVDADAPRLAAIYRPAVLTGTASFEIDPPDAEEMLRRLQAIRSGGFPYLVAVAEGEVVGFGYFSAYRPRPAYRWTVEDSSLLALRRGWLGGRMAA